MQQSLLWYDLETWGTDPATSGIASFACQRTDHQLNPIEEPVRLMCKPPEDCLPEPGALLVHGISPQQADEEGLDEYQFARAIHQQLNQSDSCVVGFNNIRFDDEFCRYLFYRNLLDPYTHQWRNNNSRWDVIDSFRVCHAFKPNALDWLEDDNGHPSFALQSMAQANGIAVTQAHDALSDVDTTIALTRLLLEREPQLYQHMFSIRTKNKVSETIGASTNKVFAHVSGMLPARHGRVSLIVLLACDREISTRWHSVDLHANCSDLLSLSVNDIKALVFTRRDELPEDADPPRLKTVHTNRCPALLPPKMLSTEVANRLEIDLELCKQNYQLIDNNRSDIALKIQEVFERSTLESFTTSDVNRQLYDGFFGDQDVAAMSGVHQTPIEQWHETLIQGKDERLSKLWLRLLGRNQPQLLSATAGEQWNGYLSDLCNGRIDRRAGITTLLSQIEDITSKDALDERGKELMNDLDDYLRKKAARLGIELVL